MNINDKLAKVAKNKSLLKEYSNSSNERIVYLDDGDEFQLQIFNPYSYVIGVSITFNSTHNSNSLLVLKPGERVWLDRYLDNSNKMKFSTYKVNNSKAVQEAIKNNGDIDVKFYKEKQKSQVTVWYNNTYDSYNVNNNKPWWEQNQILCNAEISNANNYCNYCDTSLSLDSCLSSITTATAATGIPTSATYSCTSTSTANKQSTPLSRGLTKSIETGRVEEGGYSNQKFNNYYGDFESWYFKKETIKLLPKSQKQYSSSDLEKKYCPECGRKIKDKFKFCPFCGEKL